eukprot:CAMPEP_0178413266 /NCGR_PEP_ID=MMETSP0689_2-20121128/22440_1 /TAXON_ID=160604 /ORGANISM="Amphidinium massartii, Strain CS-259" /LENGTH=940 /DNA_ID=CAMNT_0020034535 /DNA_START=39 /DNA_END=2861 /DNA_ORIENTATION=-
MSREWNEDVAKMAQELQKYQHMYKDSADGLEVPVPRFVLIGLQSIGKTRLLSCIARRKLGGAEQNKTGTRCPVVYSFEPSSAFEYQVGEQWNDMQPKQSPKEVSDFLSNHMTMLGEKAVDGSPERGFTTEPVFVCVKGPGLPCFELVDLPGLRKVDPAKGDHDDKCNNAMRTMYKESFKNKNTVPVLLTQFETNLDTEQSIAEFNRLVADAGITKEMQQKALVFITRLDAIRHVKEENVTEMLNALKKLNVQEHRIVIASLKPEFFGEDDKEVESDDHYFGVRFMELESRCLLPWVEKKQLRKNAKFGLRELFNLLNKDLAGSMSSNSCTILNVLTTRLKQEIASAEELICQVEPLDKQPSLSKKIGDYVSLYTKSLAASATRDFHSHIDDNVRALKRDYACCHGLSEKQLSDRLHNETRMTFDEELERFGNGSTHEVWFTSKQTLEFLRRNAKGTSACELSPDTSLGGSAAVDRLLRLLCISFMVTRLRVFDRQELADLMGGRFNANKAVQLDLYGLLRKMMEEMKPPASQTEALCKWCCGIYSFQAEQVCEVLRTDVGLLQEHPRLRELIDDCIQDQYGAALDTLANEAQQRILDVTQSSFKLMNIDHFHNMAIHTDIAKRTLARRGCIPNPEVSEVGAQTTSPQCWPSWDALQGARDRILEAAQPMKECASAGSIAQSLLKSVLSGAGMLTSGCSAGVLCALGCGLAAVGVVGDASKRLGRRVSKKQAAQQSMYDAEFARSERSQILAVAQGAPPLDVGSDPEVLNDVAQALARYTMGNLSEGTKTIIYDLLVNKVSQIPSEIPSKLACIHRLLLSEAHKDYLAALTSNADSTWPDRMDNTKAKLEKLANDVNNFRKFVQSGHGQEKAAKFNQDPCALVHHAGDLVKKMANCQEEHPRQATNEAYDFLAAREKFVSELRGHLAGTVEDQRSFPELRL